MKIIRYICNIIFVIILALFTVSYTMLPIINAYATAIITLPLVDGKKIGDDIIEHIKAILYTEKVNINNTDTKYSEIDSSADTFSTVLKYSFIFVSVCIGLVILLSLIGMKRISYIPLILSQIVMITFSIILVIVYSTHYLTDIISNIVNNQANLSSNGAKVTISNASINYDIGGILITFSTALLIVNNILYSFLG